MWFETLAGEDRQCGKEDVDALVRNQPPQEDEITGALNPRQNAEELVAVGILDGHGRPSKILGHGLAHREGRRRIAQEVALEPVPPGDASVRLAVPAMVGYHPGTAHQQ